MSSLSINPRAASDSSPSTLTVVSLDAPAVPGPLYLRDAIRVARFDGDAIGRLSQDRRALFYGAGYLAAATFVTNAVSATSGQTAEQVAGPSWLTVVIASLIVVPLQLLASALNVGLIHAAARLFFGATGRWVGLLRVIWLGSIVAWLTLIPVVGPLAGGIWSLLITLVTFEEVDGIERLQALALAVVSGLFMLLAGAVVTRAFT